MLFKLFGDFPEVSLRRMILDSQPDVFKSGDQERYEETLEQRNVTFYRIQASSIWRLHRHSNHSETEYNTLILERLLRKGLTKNRCYPFP